MRHALALLLLFLLPAVPEGIAAPDGTGAQDGAAAPDGATAAEEDGPLGDGKTFELPRPGGLDWDVAKPDKDAKVLLTTEFAGSDPKATGQVRVMVYPLSGEFRKKALDEIARDWAATIESEMPKDRKITEGKSELGGEEAWVRDIRTSWARLTWHIARKNDTLYMFHVLRTNIAMDDADLDAQLADMRASIRFLGEAKAPPDAQEKPRPPEPPPIDPEKLKRTERTLSHWRLQLVKPEGLLEVPAEEFTASEMANDMIAKFERRVEQSVIMVRIYARTAATRKLTLDQLVDQKIKRFEQAYDKASRLPVERDQAWKPPLVDRAIRLVLTGRKGTVQTTRWFLAECKNDRQYQIEVYVSGGDADLWTKVIQDLLDGFQPQRDS